MFETLQVAYKKDYSALYGNDFWASKHTRGRHSQHYAYFAKPGCYFSAPRTCKLHNSFPTFDPNPFSEPPFRHPFHSVPNIDQSPRGATPHRQCTRQTLRVAHPCASFCLIFISTPTNASSGDGISSSSVWPVAELDPSLKTLPRPTLWNPKSFGSFLATIHPSIAVEL